MPVSITVHSEPVVGPGTAFTLTSDFIGPIPMGWIWRLIIVDETEGAAWVASVPANGAHSVSGVVGVQSDGWGRENLDLYFPPEGTAVSVVGHLTTAGSLIEDTGTRTDLTWTTQGNFVRQTLVEQNAPAALTELQAVQLASIPAAVQIAFTGSLGELILRPIGDLVLHPPVRFLIEADDPLVLTGRGSLTRPAGPIPVNAFGAVLSFFTIPSGFGFRDGVVLEYQQRIIQLATVHELANGSREVLTEVLDLNTDGFLWLWKTALPERILYDVTPGCIVILRWLAATIPTG